MILHVSCKISNVLYILLYISFLILIETNERYKNYLEAIQNAEQNYKECNNTKHECFKDVITRDLRPFKKKGISEEMIEAARTRYLQ